VHGGVIFEPLKAAATATLFVVEDTNACRIEHQPL